MSEEMMNTKEVAQYLGIHEKQVYALIGQKRIPATRVTGKWVFPRKLIDEWIESSARSGLEQARQKTKRVERRPARLGEQRPRFSTCSRPTCEGCTPTSTCFLPARGAPRD